MTPDFARFLDDVLVGNRSHATPGCPIFIRTGKKATPADLASAEQRLDVVLPDSYRYFLLCCGPGEWCEETIPQPDALYRFGRSCWEMEGFISLVHNACCVGNCVAFNPANPAVARESPVYYCSHDPFGYAKVADSFEHWARRIVEEDGELYSAVQPAILAKWEAYKASHPRSWFQCHW